jgi:hypothetical protein
MDPSHCQSLYRLGQESTLVQGDAQSLKVFYIPLFQELNSKMGLIAEPTMT